ncbi:MAG: Ig-like domain-containing protein, partial [Planctomycetia bacterium]
IQNGTLTNVVSANGGRTWTATFTPTNGIVAPSNAITLNLAGVQTLSTGRAGNTTASVTYSIDTTQLATDLQIAVTNGQSSYIPGAPVTYTVTVTNAGPVAVSNARLVSVLPAAIRGADVTWTASYTGTGSTGAQNGSGSIDQLITLASGGTAVYLVTAAVSPTATSGLATLFTIATPGNTSDTNPANNAVVDADSLVVTPAIVLGSDVGCTSQPIVRLVDPSSGSTRLQFTPYEAAFIGGIRVATGDVTGDGVDEIIVAPGRGRAGEIRVFTQWGYELLDYRTVPFGATYTSGVEVAVGDVTGDGIADIVASMSAGLSQVRVFRVSPASADPVIDAPVFTLQPFGTKFAGGASVAVGDVGTFSGGVTRNVAVGDGRGELIVASGAGIGATVQVYDLSGASPRLIDTINPFGGATTVGPLTLSVGRYDSDTITDIAISSGSTGGSRMEVYSGRVDDRTDLRLLALAPFATTQRANAAVYSVGLDLDRNGVVEEMAFVQGLGGNAGVVRQTSRTGTLLRERSFPASPLRIAAINNGPLPVATANRFAALSALNGVGSVAAKQAAFAAFATQAAQVNADGSKRWRR